MIGFTLDEEQGALQQLAHEFADREIAPVALEYDRKGAFPWPIIRKAHRLGLMNITIESEYGGGGLGWLESCIVHEELARACAGVTTCVAAHELGLTPLELAATPEQKKRFLEPIVREGKLAAYGLTEPGAGSDAAAIQTRAIRDGDDYVLSGTKHFISNGTEASLYTVFAVTDPSKRHRGISAFLVERESKGIDAHHMGDKMGHRTSDTAEIVFDEVRVPASHLLGKEGEGFKIAMMTFDRTRVTVGASGVGIARSALEKSIKFAKERKQFGQTISNFQAIQFMLADMEIRIETARLATWYAAWLVDRQLPYSNASAIAKCYGGDIALQCAEDAVQIHGGYGYFREFGVEKLMRDAKLLQIYEGTNQIQRVIIAKDLLRD